jgi:hypothetical protein
MEDKIMEDKIMEDKIMEDKIMEETINELLKQNDNNNKTLSERKKELDNVLSQLTENINKNFENVAFELRKILQKIPYSSDTVAETLEKDGYKIYILSYRDAKEDNFICIKKRDLCLISIYKYRECIYTKDSDKAESLYAKVFLLQNVKEIKAMLLRVFYSVVKRSEELRKYEIEKLETKIRILESVNLPNTEEKQWSDYISYVLVWCSENQQKTDNCILSFDEWKHIE